jgi:hypothetical protein
MSVSKNNHASVFGGIAPVRRFCHCLLLFLAQAALAFQPDTPVTPGASPEAQAMLNYFAHTYGRKIIAGQHDGWQVESNGLSRELNYIRETSGKLPALVEWDVSGCAARDHETNHLLMKRALDWAQSRRGLAGFCWHWRAPMNEPSFYVKETSFDISRAVTPGTPEYDGMVRDLDAVAGELEVLRDARVPVVWRPLHEANGRWFWWGAGGPEPFKKLWRLMFENFTVKHRLNNLIWEFSPGAETDLAAWYPGDAFVDIIGADNYPMDGNHNPAGDIFDELSKMTRGQKLIALGENGPIPNPALLAGEKAGWLFFSTWSGSILFDKTSTGQLREYFQNPRVLTLADLPDLKTFSTKPSGAPAKLTFLGTPGNVALGNSWRMPLTVAVQDRMGRTVRAGDFSVTLALKNARGATLSGTLTAKTVNGVAAFDDLKISDCVQSCELIATAAGLHRATSAAFGVGPGNGLVRETWTGAADPSNSEDAKEILGAAIEAPMTLATNFSARIRGSLIAPQSGDYRFAIASAGSSELWLSTDTSPANKAKIAAVTASTPYRKWPHINEADSQVVKLVAGQKYYLEIRQRQPAGSTQLHVRWQLPDGTEERPIPAFRFERLKN